MSELVVVGISDYKISNGRTLATYALGSCVGTSILDGSTGIGGLSHIMLPDSKINNPGRPLNRMKFADTAIADMVNEMIRLGADPKRMTAKLAGGANMFDTVPVSAFGDIGRRNLENVKDILGRLGIPIVGEDTGANYGRTVFFDPSTGKVTVKSIGREIKEL